MNVKLWRLAARSFDMSVDLQPCTNWAVSRRKQTHTLAVRNYTYITSVLTKEVNSWVTHRKYLASLIHSCLRAPPPISHPLSLFTNIHLLYTVVPEYHPPSPILSVCSPISISNTQLSQSTTPYLPSSQSVHQYPSLIHSYPRASPPISHPLSLFTNIHL